MSIKLHKQCEVLKKVQMELDVRNGTLITFYLIRKKKWKNTAVVRRDNCIYKINY